MIRNIVRGFLKFFLFFSFRVKIVGAENVNTEKGVIVAPNHRSNWDAVILGVATKRELRFLAKSELFKNKLGGMFLKWFGAFPIERGKGDIAAVRTALKVLGEGEALLIFPEGTRKKVDDNGPAKTGVVMMASHAKVPIVPVYISGDYRWMNKITVTFGKPIDVSEGVEGRMSKELMQEKADMVLNTIRSLKV